VLLFACLFTACSYFKGNREPSFEGKFEYELQLHEDLNDVQNPVSFIEHAYLQTPSGRFRLFFSYTYTKVNGVEKNLTSMKMYRGSRYLVRGIRSGSTIYVTYIQALGPATKAVQPVLVGPFPKKIEDALKQNDRP
jgi:hypothetical protein